MKLDSEEGEPPHWVSERTWHNLGMGTGTFEGKILVSIEVFDKRLPIEKPIDITPETTLYEIDLNILGLRGLLPSGIMPIQKPFIKFNLKSLLPPKHQGRLENLFTDPCPGGSDPTIKTIVKFKVQLPKDLSLCPSLGVSK
jgi:hypothetical protein